MDELGIFQQTLSTEIRLEGIGMHSGKSASITLTPAPENTGLRFSRSDLNHIEIPVSPTSLVSAQRATHLQCGTAKVETPEHLLSACWGLNITNLIMTLDSEEVPILDGSAKGFVDAMLQAGITPQSTPIPTQTITEPMWFTEGQHHLLILPSKTRQWTYCLDYPQAFIGQQRVTLTHNPDTYITDVAPARTYGFKHEVDALRARGLALGGSLDNALVIDENGYLNPPRFPDEMARHKLLDLIGDFACLGVHLKAHIIGIKSGHSLHMKAVQACAK